jgi:molecular chaperone GrpE (heat shock protein)
MSRPDYSEQLRSLMHAVSLTSFRRLSQAAGVSEWQVQQLRQGKATQMRLEPLSKLSQVLQVPLTKLVETFAEGMTSSHAETSAANAAVLDANAALRQEYEHLKAQLAEQREGLWQEFQQATLHVLESWLIQFPTAVYAVQQNPNLPATRLLPLMRPLEQLLQQWGVEAIAAVGSEVPYDPQQHQLLEGEAAPGDRVRVRNTGYRQGDRLLHRAKVSPV